MDVLAFIASPFSASTCPPRLREAMEAGLLRNSNPAVGNGALVTLRSVEPANDHSDTTISSSTISGRS